MKVTYLIALAAVLGVNGCANDSIEKHQTLSSNTTQNKKKAIKPHGYLIASLTYSGSFQNYFVSYENTDTGRLGVLHAGSDPVLVKNPDRKSSFLANGSVFCKVLPPGHYKISSIVGASGAFRLKANDEPSINFTISNEKVSYLGNFHFIPTQKFLATMTEAEVFQRGQLETDWDFLKIRLSKLSPHKINYPKKPNCTDVDLPVLTTAISELLLTTN